MPVTFVDPYDRFPALKAYLEGLLVAESSRDWSYLRSVILAEGDGLERVDEALDHLAGKAVTLDEWFPAVVQSNPDDALASALHARRGVNKAWAIRTGARAKDLPSAQITGFRAAIIEVEVFLVGAIARNPDYPHLWISRLSSGMGAGVGLSEITRRYARLSRITPHFYDGAIRYWQAIQPKWYGSWEAALEWARAEAASAPEGSMMRVLPMRYYVDRWWGETDDSDTTALIRSEKVRQELVEAARGSVLHPAHISQVATASNHAKFAWVFSHGQHWADAWPHFQCLGPYPALSDTWEYTKEREGSYEKCYNEARKTVGA